MGGWGWQGKALLAFSHKQKLKKSKHMQAQQTIMNWGGGVTQEAQILPIAYPSIDDWSLNL